MPRLRAGGAAGFVLGDVITEGLGWEWVFLLNVPVGMLGLILAPVLLNGRRVRRCAPGRREENRRQGGWMISSSSIVATVPLGRVMGWTP